MNKYTASLNNILMFESINPEDVNTPTKAITSLLNGRPLATVHFLELEGRDFIIRYLDGKGFRFLMVDEDDETYIVYRPEVEARAEALQTELLNEEKDHVAIGRLLGYSESSIKQFMNTLRNSGSL